jgi:hypothetical protein
MLCANSVIPATYFFIIFTGIWNLVNYKKPFNSLMLKWMWNELHVYCELYYIYFLRISWEKVVIICNSCVIEHYGFGMAFAYSGAMAGSSRAAGIP